MGENRLGFWLAIIGLVVLLVLPVPRAWRLKMMTRDGMAPYQNLISMAMDRLAHGVEFLGSVRTAIRERSELVVRIAELQQQVWELESERRENSTLKLLLGYRDQGSRKLVLGRVIARGETSGWWQTIRINRGDLDGVKVDQAVVTESGLVGRTLEVTDLTADVLLVTDPRCRVACRFVRTGALGILRGGGFTAIDSTLEMMCAPRPFRVDYMAKELEILDGDEVVTSGLGGVFPDGVPVGRVERSGLHSSGLYQSADVVPLVALERLRYVFVVVPGDRIQQRQRERSR
ncbi:MAG: rod shape-determining protein MreC [Lentisphaerae bacterium RIFOXYC12_FULL_60_16]|nr:MAG: rod shape-determining protein MreC [Lentisphaerae bacterium RIFOXYC12_FULL_60_16]OGV68512.1 MAG: rod shape-determining protein MreC [Lentisphaerae bacterium RIFOXYA12_FULL_60_10]OGV83481.1 MAG: rod shape-determining protein MreC [Lentisphaerae bacterium RIFOXYB12_FULL_60_10]